MRRWRWDDGVSIAESRGSYRGHRQRWPHRLTLTRYRLGRDRHGSGPRAVAASRRAEGSELRPELRREVERALRSAGW